MEKENRKSSLKQLSANQLSKMLNETQAELKRRQNIEKARKEIQAVLKKYRITSDDLDLGVGSKRQVRKKSTAPKSKGKNASAKKEGNKKNITKGPLKNDQRTAVAAKYHNPETGDKWSGRGRPPVWVTSLCSAQTIDIEQFKADPRFRI